MFKEKQKTAVSICLIEKEENGFPYVLRCYTFVHIVSFYVCVTNGVHMKDGELPGTSYEAEFRYASTRFWKIELPFQNIVKRSKK